MAEPASTTSLSGGRVPSTEDLRRSYDEIPYPNFAKPFTHIARLAAVGRLRGLEPRSPAKCRVLELGVADGGNLLPMAIQFPASRFVGIDLSPVQIEIGLARTEELALPNVELRVSDILELGDEELGEFDYIIVHGVFSWVPVEIRRSILSICQRHLSDRGLAYISYNTFPGWRGKQAVREFLQYHTRSTSDLRRKAEAALEMIQMLPGPEEQPGDPGAMLVRRLRKDIEGIRDPLTYLIHEYLVDVNEPYYFRDFCREIESFALQYVDDAYPGSTSLDRMPPGPRRWIDEQVSDYHEQQQYVDFVCNISFRRSVLCRADLQVKREVTWDAVRPLHATATCRRDTTDDGKKQFITAAGRRFSVDHPGVKRAIESLVDAQPESLAVQAFRDAVGADVDDTEAAAICADLVSGDVLELSSHPHPCVATVGERPRASRLARTEAATGIVTNAAHRPVNLENPFERTLLQLLDGTRTVPDLSGEIRRRLTPDKPIRDDRWDELVQDHLERLAELGLISP